MASKQARTKYHEVTGVPNLYTVAKRVVETQTFTRVTEYAGRVWVNRKNFEPQYETEETLAEYLNRTESPKVKLDWVILDLFTASAIIAVYESLNQTNRDRMDVLPIRRQAHVAMKLANGNR